MKERKLNEFWLSYVKATLPADVSPLQLTECKRCFFAGVRGLMHIVFSGLTPGPDSTPADEAMMIGLQQELDEFGRDVEAGRA